MAKIKITENSPLKIEFIRDDDSVDPTPLFQGKLEGKVLEIPIGKHNAAPQCVQRLHDTGPGGGASHRQVT